MRQADDVTPEEAQKAYNRYKRETAARSAKLFFDKHSQEDWLRERYDYSHDCMMNRRDRVAKDRVRAQNLEVFQRLREQGLVMLPYFEDTSPLGYLVIPGIPPTVSRAAIAETIKGLNGLCHFTLGTPNEQGFIRTAYFLFTDKDKASAAFSSAFWTSLNLPVAPQLPTTPLHLIRTPRPFSVNVRADKDLQQCSTLVEAFDARHGLTQTLFKDDSTSLPLLLAYLREVHMYDYFRCTQYDSMDQVIEKCTALDGDCEDDYDVANWDSKVDVAYEKALEQAKVPVVVEDVPWAAQLTALTNTFNEQNVQKKSDTKYKCMQCAKLFLGPQFVIKHLQTKHAAQVDGLKTKACQSLYFENYMSDENRPFDPPTVSRNARAPDSSRRRERKESRRSRSRSRSQSRPRDRSPKRRRDRSPRRENGAEDGEKKERDTHAQRSDAKDADRSRQGQQGGREHDNRSNEGHRGRWSDRGGGGRGRGRRGGGGGGPRPPVPVPEEKDALGNRSIVSYVEVAYADPDKPVPEESLVNLHKKPSETVDLDYGFGSFDFSTLSNPAST